MYLYITSKPDFGLDETSSGSRTRTFVAGTIAGAVLGGAGGMDDGVEDEDFVSLLRRVITIFGVWLDFLIGESLVFLEGFARRY